MQELVSNLMGRKKIERLSLIKAKYLIALFLTMLHGD